MRSCANFEIDVHIEFFSVLENFKYSFSVIKKINNKKSTKYFDILRCFDN